MVEVVAIVEGQTEQTFVGSVLAGHLSLHGVSIWAVLSGKSRRRGGVPLWESARGDILRTMKEGRIVTTMFDYYGMPADWPGREQAKSLPGSQRAAAVEAAMVDDIASVLGSKHNARLFVPYVQLHEFEAILFADPQQTGDTLAPFASRPSARLVRDLEKILNECGGPEDIDDGYETCPSRRIGALAPNYRKPLFGPIVASRVGLETIRERCPHFAKWLSKLETLGASADAG